MPAPDLPAEVDPRFASRAASRFAAEPRTAAETTPAVAPGDEPVALLRALLTEARARASLTGAVEFIAPDSADHAAARAIYLARFPQAEAIFDLADLSLLRMTPRSARVIGGFAQAASLVGDRLQQPLR